MPEGPRWGQGRLFFSDIHARDVVAVDLDGARETIVDVAQRPNGLGWLPDGALLIASMDDNTLFRFDDRGLTAQADLSAISRFGLGDMVVDATGRAYVGFLPENPATSDAATGLVFVDCGNAPTSGGRRRRVGDAERHGRPGRRRDAGRGGERGPAAHVVPDRARRRADRPRALGPTRRPTGRHLPRRRGLHLGRIPARELLRARRARR
jgi:SMP-30/gluconolaconase/LRE-like protein